MRILNGELISKVRDLVRSWVEQNVFKLWSPLNKTKGDKGDDWNTGSHTWLKHVRWEPYVCPPTASRAATRPTASWQSRPILLPPTPMESHPVR